jgi:hypothetical protein
MIFTIPTFTTAGAVFSPMVEFMVRWVGAEVILSTLGKYPEQEMSMSSTQITRRMDESRSRCVVYFPDEHHQVHSIHNGAHPACWWLDPTTNPPD